MHPKLYKSYKTLLLAWNITQVKDFNLKINKIATCHDLKYYFVGVQGIGQSSGAYVFRPDNSGRKKITDNPTVSHINGPLVNETIFTLNDWAVMSTRHNEI